MAGAAEVFVGLRVLADLSFVLACFASCLAVLAVILRFAARRLPSLGGLKANAYGMYLVHYLFVVWLQFAMLGADLPASIKAAVVFGSTLVLSWGAVAGLGRLPSVGEILGTGRARGAAPS